MAEFQCKMCCAAKFRSLGALKMHISKALEDVCCPECESKFDKFSEMIEHLAGGDCDTDNTAVTVNALTMKSEVAKGKEDEVDDDDTFPDELEDEDEEGVLSDGADLGAYYCQQCEMHFDHVDEHLDTFHEGQEVVMEQESDAVPEEIPRNDSSTLDKIYVITTDQLEKSTSSKVIEGSEVTDQSPSNQSSTDQSIVDKGGRTYTRKFVKIDKFWLDALKAKTVVRNAPAKTELPLPPLHHFTFRGSKVIEVKEEMSEEQNDTKEPSKEPFMACPDCHCLYSSMEAFQNHKCGGYHVKCGHCMQNFSSPEALKIHSLAHVKTLKNFICALCNTTFPTFKSLKLHKKMHGPITTDPLSNVPVSVCVVCNKSVDNKVKQIHMATHLADELICKICNRKLLNKSSLEMHLKIHANSSKKFACSYCKKTFNAFEALKDHLQNQCQKRMYACQYCGRRFGRPHEKVKHERIHTGEKPHKCDICGKAFRVSYCLTLHKRTHSGVRPYQCQQCGKSFKSLGVFNHHVMTHSEVRAYKCPYCPKAFKTSVQLAGHKNCHTKPFKCTECNRPFSTLYGVRAHMESHGKPQNNLVHECWICGAQYSRAFALKEHMRQVHDGADAEKPVDEDVMDTATKSIITKGDGMIIGFQTVDIMGKE